RAGGAPFSRPRRTPARRARRGPAARTGSSPEARPPARDRAPPAAGRDRRRRPSSRSEPPHVGHAAAGPGAGLRQAQRCARRPLGEDRAALGAVAELDALAVGGEDHLMVARDRATAQRGVVDAAFLALVRAFLHAVEAVERAGVLGAPPDIR